MLARLQEKHKGGMPSLKRSYYLVIFAFDKFHSYLIGTKVIVYTNYEALKFLLTKRDAKPKLIRWILLL